MAIELPPKNAPFNQPNLRLLSDALTAMIAGHPGSLKLWTFYEVVDNYLGPWGEAGYPIGYGKHYCRLFTENEKLAADPQAADWVKRTMVALQEALRDFMVEQFRKGRLASITEPEFRQAAFASHADAYTDSGLSMVILVAPELIPVIMSIPAREFNPGSHDFNATIKQVLETAETALPSCAGLTLAAAMPAHSGLLRNAAMRDRLNEVREGNTIAWLARADRAVKSGQMDNISALCRLTDRLYATQFGDQLLAQRAREIIVQADQRKRDVAAYYRRLIDEDEDMQTYIDKADPGWSRW